MVAQRISGFCVVLVLAGGCLSVGGGEAVNGGQTAGSQSSSGNGGQTTGSAGTTTGGRPGCSPPCGANATCNRDGTCTCYPNYTNCTGTDGGSVCSNIELDNDNCGGCDQACPTGTRCLGAQCTCYLTICLVDAGWICTDTSRDPMNCGACNSPCPQGEGCSMNQCD